MLLQEFRHVVVRSYLDKSLQEFHVHAVWMWHCFLWWLRHFCCCSSKLVESAFWVNKCEIRVWVDHGGLFEILNNFWHGPQIVAFKGEFDDCSAPIVLVYEDFAVEDYGTVTLDVNH